MTSNKLKRIFTNAFVFLCSCIVTFVILEVGACVWLHKFADDERFFIYASHNQLQERFKTFPDHTPKYLLHRYAGYYPNPKHTYRLNKHNSRGFRGDEITMPKPENEFRIVCLGGSTTYTGHVNDYHFSYPYLLQEELNARGYRVSVVNAAAEAYSSYESLITFQFRALDVDPDMVIVYHAVNDMIQRFVWPPEYYKSDNSGSRGPVVSERFMPPIWEYSTLIRALLIKTNVTLPHSALPKFYDVHVNTFYGFEWRNQKRAGTYPSGIFQEVDMQTMVEANPPTYFRRNIESLVAVARQFEVTAILATFAHCPDFNDEPWGTDPEFTWTYDAMNELLKKIAHDTNAELFDFAATFPKDQQYFADGIHMNQTGAQLKAKHFADFILDQGLIPEQYKATTTAK